MSADLELEDALWDRRKRLKEELPDNRLVESFVTSAPNDDDAPLLKSGSFLLPSASVTVIYGLTSAGKSFFTVDLACALATGAPWYESGTRRPLNVMYLQLEGRYAQIQARVGAWQAAHPEAPSPFDRLTIFRLTRFDWDSDDDIEALVELAESDEIAANVIVIDTLDAGRVSGSNMADEQTGRIFAQVLPRLVEGGEHGERTVFLVAHSNAKDDNLAGLSRQRNAVEAIVHVQKRGRHRVAILEKIKDIDGRPEIVFDIVDSPLVQLDDDDQSLPVGVVEQSPGRARRAPGDEPAGCSAWLAGYLAENDGAALSSAIKAAADGAGYGERALRRARQDLEIEIVKDPKTHATTWAISS